MMLDDRAHLPGRVDPIAVYRPHSHGRADASLLEADANAGSGDDGRIDIGEPTEFVEGFL